MWYRTFEQLYCLPIETHARQAPLFQYYLSSTRSQDLILISFIVLHIATILMQVFNHNSIELSFCRTNFTTLVRFPLLSSKQTIIQCNKYLLET